METTNDWEFLGNNKSEVIQRVLAEANARKHLDTYSGFLVKLISNITMEDYQLLIVLKLQIVFGL